MCEPVSMAAAWTAVTSMSQAAMFATSLAVSGATAAVSYMGQQQMATAQVEAQEANLLNTRNAAAESQRRQDADLHARESQMQASTALTLDNNSKARDRAAATASASSESAGLSLEGLMTDYDRQYSSFADSQMMQLGWDRDQVQRTREGIASQAQGRVNSIPRTPVQRPSLAGAALSFAGNAFDAYGTYSTRDPMTGNRTLS